MQAQANQGDVSALDWVEKRKHEREVKAETDERRAEAMAAAGAAGPGAGRRGVETAATSNAVARATPLCASRSPVAVRATNLAIAMSTTSGFALGLALGGIRDCSSVRDSCQIQCVATGQLVVTGVIAAQLDSFPGAI